MYIYTTNFESYDEEKMFQKKLIAAIKKLEEKMKQNLNTWIKDWETLKRNLYELPNHYPANETEIKEYVKLHYEKQKSKVLSPGANVLLYDIFYS